MSSDSDENVVVLRKKAKNKLKDKNVSKKEKA
jgi:hypothetical protein